MDPRTQQQLDSYEIKSFGRPLRELSEADWACIQPRQAAHWDLWDYPPPQTIADEAEILAEFYAPQRRTCPRCGWWSEFILSNHGAGADYTATAVLQSFDLHGTEITIPEIVSHLSRRFSDIYTLSPRRFEEVIASVYRSMGWTVTLTKQSRDGGIDLFCVTDASKVVCIVECKRYSKSRKVSIGAVDRLLGVSFRIAADQAHLVTTSSFSEPAHAANEMASARGVSLSLIDAHELALILGLYADKSLTLGDIKDIFTKER